MTNLITGNGNETNLNDVTFEEIQSDFSNQSSTASRILEKRRQLAEVHDALEAQKDEFARKIDAFRRREEALRKKDLRLQDSLIKFNKFLQENENKRTRAMKRCADECRIREAKEKEIANLKDLLSTKTNEERDLATKLERNKKYQHYLKCVIEQVQVSSDDYSEIQDILDRFQTLKTTNNDLLRQLQKNTKDHEAGRLSYTQFTKKSGNAILNMNNEIATLQKEMEQVTVKLNNTESLDDGTARDVTELTADLSQIFVVVDQIVERFESRTHRSKPKSNKEQRNFDSKEKSLDEKTKGALEKLDKITEYMTDYKSIADDWERSQSSSSFPMNE